MSAFKPVLQGFFHDFAPQHIYGYAFAAKSLQLHVSLRFSVSRFDNYCKTWVKEAGHRVHYNIIFAYQ